MRGGHRSAKALGCALGALILLLIALFLLRGFGALMMGGLKMLNDAANVPAVPPAATAQPTMPPLDEETPLPEETGAELADPVELPVVATPEQLAETAVDLTPPPDAPIG